MFTRRNLFSRLMPTRTLFSLAPSSGEQISRGLVANSLLANIESVRKWEQSGRKCSFGDRLHWRTMSIYLQQLRMPTHSTMWWKSPAKEGSIHFEAYIRQHTLFKRQEIMANHKIGDNNTRQLYQLWRRSSWNHGVSYVRVNLFESFPHECDPLLGVSGHPRWCWYPGFSNSKPIMTH